MIASISRDKCPVLACQRSMFWTLQYGASIIKLTLQDWVTCTLRLYKPTLTTTILIILLVFIPWMMQEMG